MLTYNLYIYLYICNCICTRTYYIFFICLPLTSTHQMTFAWKVKSYERCRVFGVNIISLHSSCPHVNKFTIFCMCKLITVIYLFSNNILVRLMHLQISFLAMCCADFSHECRLANIYFATRGKEERECVVKAELKIAVITKWVSQKN